MPQSSQLHGLAGRCPYAAFMSNLNAVWPPSPIMTSRLLLRPSEPRDRQAYIELFSSPRVWTYLGGARNRDELEALVPEIPGNHAGIFVVDKYGDLVGTVVFDRRDPERPGHIRDGGGELEVSYTFLPKYWGQGYAGEAVEAALGWAASALTDDDVLLCTQMENAPSMRLAHRLGFVEAEQFEEFGAEQWLGRRSLRANRV
jgi:RimJ/RimL family protein N-acetyltransferase